MSEKLTSEIKKKLGSTSTVVVIVSGENTTGATAITMYIGSDPAGPHQAAITGAVGTNPTAGELSFDFTSNPSYDALPVGNYYYEVEYTVAGEDIVTETTDFIILPRVKTAS